MSLAGNGGIDEAKEGRHTSPKGEGAADAVTIGFSGDSVGSTTRAAAGVGAARSRVADGLCTSSISPLEVSAAYKRK